MDTIIIPDHLLFAMYLTDDHFVFIFFSHAI